MTIGERIREQRKAQHLTMQELADKLGVAKPTVHKYESGLITNIPINQVRKLADALDCTPSFLMGWKEPSEIADEDLIATLVANSRRLSPERKSDCIKLLRYLYPELFD